MLSIATVRSQLDTKEKTVKEVIDGCLAIIKEKNPTLNALIEIYDDAVIAEQIEKAQNMLDAGEGKSLTGVPYAIKDNILFLNQIASAGSNILKNYRASYDAHAVQILKEQGAVCLGRANMDDSAMGSSTESSIYGETLHPENPDYVPGGSSGGSVVAVASGMVAFALGSDTGGSVRQPAGFCGIVGYKPSYGALSRAGLIALGSSFDCVGPIASNVSDVQMVYYALAHHDPLDATSVDVETRENTLSQKIKKIGVPRNMINQDGVSQSVRENFDQTLQALEEAGYEIIDIEMEYTPLSLPVYYITLPAEASTNLARYDGIRYGLSVEGEDLADGYFKTKAAGYGKEVKRRILVGAYVLSAGYYDAYYGKATKVRNLIKKEFDTLFDHVDVILTPTSPTSAFKIGAKSDPVSMYMADLFTIPANLVGVPAVSVPTGRDKDNNNLPLAVQFMGAYLADNQLLDFANHCESLFKKLDVSI